MQPSLVAVAGRTRYGTSCGEYDRYKTDISTLSSQEVDFLFHNSDLFADFEREEVGNLDKIGGEEMKAFGEEVLYHGACQDSLRGSFPRQFMPPFSEDGTSHMHHNRELPLDIHTTKKKETRYFDDTSSWSTDHSEVLACNQYDATPENFPCLRANNEASRSTEDISHRTQANAHDSKEAHGTKDETHLLALPKAVDTMLIVSEGTCHRTREGVSSLGLKEEPKVVASPKLGNSTLAIEMFRNMTVQNTQEKSITRNGIKLVDAIVAMENSVKGREKELREVKLADARAMEKAVKGLDHELLELKKENKSLAQMLKEHEHKMANFAKEKVLWEQKKVSEMNMFNTFKQEEMQRLRKERSKLEKQTKLLLQLPGKKERNETEELRIKIAALTADHSKQDSLQRLTL